MLPLQALDHRLGSITILASSLGAYQKNGTMRKGDKIKVMSTRQGITPTAGHLHAETG